jgi:hypothetical protein
MFNPVKGHVDYPSIAEINFNISSLYKDHHELTRIMDNLAMNRGGSSILGKAILMRKYSELILNEHLFIKYDGIYLSHSLKIEDTRKEKPPKEKDKKTSLVRLAYLKRNKYKYYVRSINNSRIYLNITDVDLSLNRVSLRSENSAITAYLDGTEFLEKYKLYEKK